MNDGIRINFIVEGPTEETFVRDMLKEPLALKGIYINPRSVEFRRKPIKSAKYLKTGKQFTIKRGGLLDYNKAKNDIIRWISEDKEGYLTTMFDLYALPDNFPKYDDAKRYKDPYQKVKHLEAAFREDISNSRFIPYIQLHEFEGILFSDILAIDEVMRPFHGSKLTALKAIREAFDSPEEIDDGVETAPSKRLLNLYKSYEKPVEGSRIAQRIGLDRIRNECKHFNEWLVGLEALAIFR